MIFRKLFKSWIICCQQDASRDQKSLQNYQMIFRKLFESWIICCQQDALRDQKSLQNYPMIFRKFFEFWIICSARTRQEIKKSSQNYRLIICKYSNLKNYAFVDSQLTKLHPPIGCVKKSKRARDGSNKQETLVGVSGLWLLLIKRCSAKLSLQINQTKVNDFATGVPNKKRCLHSSQRLPWSSRMGWQAV